ncbi:Uncharacterised protein [Mycobacteroides abscessus subsp. abscessus]|nr:Uncharacterised protein [Mycobacteroides abscessus subsp. abscessus]
MATGSGIQPLWPSGSGWCQVVTSAAGILSSRCRAELGGVSSSPVIVIDSTGSFSRAIRSS